MCDKVVRNLIIPFAASPVAVFQTNGSAVAESKSPYCSAVPEGREPETAGVGKIPSTQTHFSPFSPRGSSLFL